MNYLKICFIISIILSLFLLSACKDKEDKIQRYRVKKPVVKLPFTMGYFPKHWKEESPKSRMTLKQYKIPTDHKTQPASMTISTAGGSLQQNIMRWMGQLGLPAQRPEKFIPLQNGYFISMANEQIRFFIFVFYVKQQQWIMKIKMAADEKHEFIQSEMEEFIQVMSKLSGIDSLNTGIPQPEPEQEKPENSESKSGMKWQSLPDGWKEAAAGGRYATILIDGKLELKINVFGGTVGGDLANINRWRGQMGLDSIDESKLNEQFTSIDHASLGSFKLVELEKDGQGMLAAMIFYEGSTWFFKLNGSMSELESQKTKFIEFIKGLNYG